MTLFDPSYLTHKKILKQSAVLLSSVLALGGLHQLVHPTSAQAAEHNNLQKTNNAFLNKILPDAYDLANKNDLYASVMMAQAALESGYGSSRLSQAPYNNLFGIKGSYKGQSTRMNTLEDDGHGNYYQIKDSFKKYPSYRESLQDYVTTLKKGPSWNPNYYKGAFKSQTNSYREATAWLTGRYATDTAYAGKLNSIIESNGLTRYDQVNPAVENLKAEGQPAVKSQSRLRSSAPVNEEVKTYTVRPGDSLWAASQILGTTVDALKAANGLKSDLIFPGQVLKLTPSSFVLQEEAPKEQVQKEVQRPESTKSYTVQPGDGLWRVAQALGTTVEELKQAYGLTSNLIFPGQVFSVKTSGTVEEVPAPVLESQKAEKVETQVIEEVSSPQTYQVQSGDTLWKIARDNGLTVEQLKLANNLQSDLIFVGQSLQLAARPGQVKISKEEAPAAQTSSQGNYVIQSGDTLSQIAVTYGVRLGDLLQANGLKVSDIIYPGQVLTLP